MNSQRSIQLLALKIALPYALAGGLWILLSDQMVSKVVSDVGALTTLQTYKGWFFVFMSAVLVYFTASQYISHFFKAERKLQESEHALSESQRTLLTLMRNLPGMAYRSNCEEECVLEFVSDGCVELTGYWPAEFVGAEATCYRRIIHADDLEYVRTRVKRAIEDGGAFQLEYRIMHRDGNMKWVWEQGCAVPSKSGSHLVIEGYIFDITEKKQLEEAHRSSERMRNIGQAASGIVHDFKNPLQMILGHIDLYRLDPRPEVVEEHLGQIERQVQNMNSMCRELLDYARGEITLDLSICDISDLLNRMVESFRPTFERAGISISHTVRQDTGASSTLPLDRERILRAVTNLVGNAREAISGAGQIRVRTWIGLDEVVVEVQDSGPGIPEEIRSTLFEPFVTRGKSGGTGLGLAITRRIVEAHEGSISFASCPQTGTTFSIRLPLRESVPLGHVATVDRVSH
ncbi:MAG: PAS domain-containing sensor histidine kinase [Candidatus Zixiibacteriota bacterium]